MKRGARVYFIVKGVVRSGTVTAQHANDVQVLYEKGSYRKVYELKRSDLAYEIEGGTNGTDGLGRTGKINSDESTARCDKQNSELHISGVSYQTGTGESKKVFKGAWQIFNVA